MRSPGFVDVDRNPPRVRDGGDAFEIGSDAAVRRADEDDEFRIGVELQRRGDLRRRDAESNVQLRMQPWREVDGDRASEDEGHEERLVQIARNDHLVARPNRRQQKGVVAGGRAIEQKEAAVGVPGVGRHRFRDAQGFAAEVGVSDAPSQWDIAAESVLAERVAQLGVGADAEFVTGGRKWDDALPLVGEHAFEKRCAPVVDRGLFPLSPSRRDHLSH